jgi:hypothetical protein
MCREGKGLTQLLARGCLCTRSRHRYTYYFKFVWVCECIEWHIPRRSARWGTGVLAPNDRGRPRPYAMFRDRLVNETHRHHHEAATQSHFRIS